MLIAVIALIRRDPSNERCAGTIAEGIRLSVELEKKVSDDSSRHDKIPFCMLLDGTQLCLQYHFVGIVAVKTLTQLQFLDPGRVETG